MLESRFKVVQSVLTSVAIVIGGVWATFEFGWFAPHKSRVNITQEVLSKRLDGDQTWVLVRLQVENVGNATTSLDQLIIRIHRVVPPPRQIRQIVKPSEVIDKVVEASRSSHRKPWNALCQRIWKSSLLLSSGEADTITQEFFIPFHVKTILIEARVSTTDDPEGSGAIAGKVSRSAVAVHEIEETKGTPHESLKTSNRSGSLVICTRHSG